LPLQTEYNWNLTTENINAMNCFPDTWNKAVHRIREATELMPRVRQVRRQGKKEESSNSKRKAEQAELEGGEPSSSKHPKINS
jgi:hypothetical protein